MSEKDKTIIKYVLLAQASNTLAHRSWRRSQKQAYYYALKEAYYKKAIGLLEGVKHSKVSFLQRREPDQNGYPSTIRYFEWFEENCGRRVQFSFHNPREEAHIKGLRSINWDGIRHLNNPEVLIRLGEVYFPKGNELIKKVAEGRL